MNENLPELDISHLRATLSGAPIGHSIEYMRIVESTMPLAHERAQDPIVRAGYVLTAEQQSAGKGRRGRSWVAPYATSLLVSAILKPPLLPPDLAQIPMAAGLAVLDALVEAEPELEGRLALKWPNDVLITSGAGAGKVAGILAESAVECGAVQYAVVGIGINVNQLCSELPSVGERLSTPTSVRAALGRIGDRTELLSSLCRRLAVRFDPGQCEGETYSAWRSHLATLGQDVHVYTAQESDVPSLSGRAVDVSANGELLVEDAAGAIHAFSAADVSVRGAT